MILNYVLMLWNGENAGQRWSEFVALHKEPLPWALCGAYSAQIAKL